MNSAAVNFQQFQNKKAPHVVLLLSNATDEKLVWDMFYDEFKISSSEKTLESGQFDLLITDEQKFHKYAFQYNHLKETEQPVLLPLLLLSKDVNYKNNGYEFSHIIDDVLGLPTSPDVFRARINLLLQSRNHSKQLEEEKRKYQLLAENSTDMISTHKTNGDYEYASPSSQNIFGYKPEELIGKNAFDFILEDDLEMVIKGREHTLKTKEPSKIEFRKKTRTGEYKWVESVIKTLDYPFGSESVQIQAATRDITDRKNYEEKLKKEISFSNAALDALPNIFYMVNSDLNFVRWNQNLEKNLGYSKEDILQMKPVDFLQKKDHKSVFKKIQEVFVVGEAELEADLITKNGRLIRHRINGRKFVEGEEEYIIGTCVDVSKDHEMMTELKASNEEKQVMLLEIHHRVKNNLAVVSSMLELQVMESENEVLSDKLRDSQARIKSIAFVHELLYQSKSFSKLNMQKYMTKLINHIKQTNKSKKNILVYQHIDPVNLNINQAIPCSLIFNELITNALKHAFTKRDEGKIHVSMVQADDHSLQLVVEDNGKGLHKEIDFKRPHSLGLQLIDVLTKQLNGKLEVTSDEGARFCLTFKKQEIKGSANNFL